MLIVLKAFLTICYLGISALRGADALAQAKPTNIALKGGETVELGGLYWVSNCKTILKATPTAEILEGPEEITIAVKEAMVLPRAQQCAKEVKGGMLSVTAKEVKQRKDSSLIIRVKYPTRDGERQNSRFYNIALFP
jgi:hypothetical protein